MPDAGQQKLRVSGTDCQIGDADLGPLIENSGPMHSAIGGFIDTALLVRTISMPQCADIDDIGVLRVDDDSANVARVLKADMQPGSTSIHRFVHAVAKGEGRPNVGLAGSGINSLRIGRRNRKSANRCDRLPIKDRSPDNTGISRLPNPTVYGAKIEGSRIARHASHGHDPAPSKRPNQPPFEPAEEFWRNRLGNR